MKQTGLQGSLASILVSAAALGTPAFVHAQDTGTAGASSGSGAAAPAPTATIPSGADAGIQDIVVTAQRRTENVQHSSLSIQVLDQDALARAGVTQAKNLSALVPGLQIAFGGNETQTFIRGVGDFSSTGLGQSAVAFNTDGVYVADQASVGPLFYDIARVEVLKGPQGTLYGRNASAGAINIITNRPTQDLGGYVTGELGNYNLRRIIGALNVPISDTLAVRGAVQYVHRDGYLSDGQDDDKQLDGRLELLWKPDSRFSVLIVGDIDHAGGSGAGAVLKPTPPGAGKFTGSVSAIDNAALLAAAELPSFLVAAPGTGPDATEGTALNPLRDSYRRNTQRNISAEFNYDLGFADVTFLPAYRTANDKYFGYTPGFPFVDYETTRQQSYELRLSKNTDFIKAVAGIYYFDNNQTIDQSAVISRAIPSLNTRLNTDLGTKSYAAFGQATVSIAPTLRLIGGLRYTHEQKTIDGSRTQVATPVSQISAFDSGATFNSVNYRAGLEYDVSPTSMAYATASTGFKAGGFNTFEPTAAVSNVYRPEKLDSYVAGIRNRFLDNRVQLNVEGFYWNYRNSQQSHLTYDPTGSLQFETLNAGKATLYGADVDVVVKPTFADTFTLTAEYLHSKFDDFSYDIPTSNYSAASIGCSARTSAAAGFTTLNCSGRPLPRAPQLSGTIDYQHRFEVGNGATLVPAVDVNFGTRRYLAVDYISSEYAPSYVREDFTVTYTAPRGKWSLAGYVRNISNQEVGLGGVEAALSPGIFYSQVDAPRTFGGRVSFNF